MFTQVLSYDGTTWIEIISLEVWKAESYLALVKL